MNQSQYTACKEFAAESLVQFEGVDPIPHKNRARSAPQAPLPPGLPLLAKFITPINSDRSFAGDPVEAEIVRDVKLPNRTIIPAHSRLFGRIVRLRRQFHRGRSVTLCSIRPPRNERASNTGVVSAPSSGVEKMRDVYAIPLFCQVLLFNYVWQIRRIRAA